MIYALEILSSSLVQLNAGNNIFIQAVLRSIGFHRIQIALNLLRDGALRQCLIWIPDPAEPERGSHRLSRDRIWFLAKQIVISLIRS